MPDITHSEAGRSAPPDIERIPGLNSEAGLIISEGFNVRMHLTPEMKGSFLEDTARFMSQFFQQRGHRVNGFNVTVAADMRMKKTVRASTGDVDIDALVVHVVMSGIGTGGIPYGASDYI